MVETDIRRRTTLGGQTIETRHDPVGIDGALDVGGERLAAELVEDVQELERSAAGSSSPGQDHSGPVIQRELPSSQVAHHGTLRAHARITKV